MEREQENPLKAANRARKEIGQSISSRTPLELTLSPQEASFLGGIKCEVLQQPFFSLIQGREQEVRVLVANEEEVAFEALRQLSEEKRLSPRVKIRCYRALVGVIQLSSQERGKEAVEGERGIFLRYVEEQRPGLSGVTEFLKQGGRISEDDLPEIQEELGRIWDSLPPASRKEIAHFRPDNI